MAFSTVFLPLTVEELPAFAAERKADDWRFVQILATRTEAGVDLIYSFMKDGKLENRVIADVTKETVVPSITNEFLAAFVFENEAHDLFGVNIEGIAIDFKGNFYQVAQSEPMTIISPEQKAAREKAAKVAAAKREKADKVGRAAAAQTAFLSDKPQTKAENGELIEPSGNDEIEAKLAGVDPEKVARVRAALAAKAKKAAECASEAASKDAAATPAIDAELEAKLAAMDPEKAAKVRAAMEAKARREAAAAKGGE